MMRVVLTEGPDGLRNVDITDTLDGREIAAVAAKHRAAGLAPDDTFWDEVLPPEACGLGRCGALHWAADGEVHGDWETIVVVPAWAEA